jgi:hypothetical protein
VGNAGQGGGKEKKPTDPPYTNTLLSQFALPDITTPIINTPSDDGTFETLIRPSCPHQDHLFPFRLTFPFDIALLT